MAVLHAAQQPIPPSLLTDVDVSVPTDLEELVMACLSKDPDRRPAGALELSGALAQTGVSRGWHPGDAQQWWVSNDPRRSGSPFGAQRYLS